MRTLRVVLAAVAAVVAIVLLGAASGCKAKPKPADVKDVVAITVDEKGFNPSSIPARRGRPITLVFTRTSDQTCATEILFPDEKIRKDLPMNTPVPVTFIPSRAGDLHFACAMNMVKGALQVIQ